MQGMLMTTFSREELQVLYGRPNQRPWPKSGQQEKYLTRRDVAERFSVTALHRWVIGWNPADWNLFGWGACAFPIDEVSAWKKKRFAMLAVKPTFKSLNCQGHSGGGEMRSSRNGFPVEVFPDPGSAIIRETESALQFPVDYSMARQFWRRSDGYQKTVGSLLKNDLKQFPYLSFYWWEGRGSISRTLYWFLRLFLQKTESCMKTFHVIGPLEGGAKTFFQRRKGFKWNFRKWGAVLRQVIVQDVTVRKVAKVLQDMSSVWRVFWRRPAWIKISSVHTGSEEQVWLQIFSSKPNKIDRKGSGQIYIPEPFVSVCGTIQPGVFSNFSRNSTTVFLDRVLLAWPEDQRKEAWTTLRFPPKQFFPVPTLWKSCSTFQGEPCAFLFHRQQKTFWQGGKGISPSEWTRERTRTPPFGKNGIVRQYVFHWSFRHCFSRVGRFVAEISERAAGGAWNLWILWRDGTPGAQVQGYRPFDRLSGLQKSVIWRCRKPFQPRGSRNCRGGGNDRRTFWAVLCDRRFFRQKKHGQYERV